MSLLQELIRSPAVDSGISRFSSGPGLYPKADPGPFGTTRNPYPPVRNDFPIDGRCLCRHDRRRGAQGLMNTRRTRAVARKEFLHIVRDPRSLAMALGMPLMMLFLLGYALILDVD